MMRLVYDHRTDYPGPVCPASSEVAVQEQALIPSMQDKTARLQDILAWAAKVTAITVALLLF
jgi:hypothetical protein